MKNILKILFVFCLTMLPLALLANQENPKLPKINWVKGPKKSNIGNYAEIMIPKGYVYANQVDTKKIMKLYGNQVTNKELAYIAPQDNSWFMIFEFDKIGYVEDDEKDDIDEDAILDSFREGTEEGNKWRKENGIAEMHLEGWHTKPFYSAATNNLEWGITYDSEGEKVINYNIRYLGRHGVMEVMVVADPAKLEEAIKQSKNILKTYNYTSGNKYTEFVEGDKIAEYGLTALIAGGTIAAAAKSGLLGRLWKFIVIGFMAATAFIKKFFRSLFGREEKSPMYNYEQQKKEEDKDK